MKKIMSFSILVLMLFSGCAIATPKKNINVQNNNKWNEMFDNNNWIPVNDIKNSKQDKVVK